jgi:hypothetical protein
MGLIEIIREGNLPKKTIFFNNQIYYGEIGESFSLKLTKKAENFLREFKNDKIFQECRESIDKIISKREVNECIDQSLK